MSWGARILLMALCLLLATAWFGTRSWEPTETPESRSNSSAASPQPAATSATQVSLSKADTGPNIATAPALFDLQRPGVAPVPLPRAIDSQLSLAEARALLVRTEDSIDCDSARSTEADSVAWERQTGTFWLESDERERVRAGRRAAIQRLLGACRRQGMRTAGTDNSDFTQGEFLWARASAAASGDVGAQLAMARMQRATQPGAETQMQSLAQTVLAGSDRDDLGRLALSALLRPMFFELAYSIPQAQSERGRIAPAFRPNQAALWLLVACDLGLDCGAASITLDRLCLNFGFCSYPNVEEALRDGQITDSEAVPTEELRQWIVAKVHAREYSTIFRPSTDPRGQ